MYVKLFLALLISLIVIDNATADDDDKISNITRSGNDTTGHLDKNSPLTCSGGNSCQGRCTEYLETERGARLPTCHCDPYCSSLQDCCVDYVEKCRAGNHTVEQETTTAAIINTNAWKCYQYINAAEAAGIWMIATCPFSYADNETRRKCEEAGNRPVTSLTTDILGNVPTVYCYGNKVGVDCVTFRNIYCARCNGKDEPSFWKITWKCDIKPPQYYSHVDKIRFLLDYCEDFRVKPRDQSPYRRYCYPVKSKCNDSYDQALKTACENGSVGLVYEKKTEQHYKNYQCLQCNGHPLETAKCGPREMISDVFNPKSFEIVLQFWTSPWRSGIQRKSRVSPSCGGGLVYDGFLEECRNGTLPDPKQSIVDKFRFKLWMKPNESGRLNDVVDDSVLEDALVKTFSLSKDEIAVISVTIEESSVATVFELQAVRSNGTKNAANSSILELNTLFQFRNPFVMLIQQKKWTVFKVTHRQLACTRPEIFPRENFTILGSQVIINNSTILNISQVHILTENHTDSGVTAGSLFVCKTFFAVACGQGEVLIGLKATDYVLQDHDTLLFKAAGVMYRSGEYELQGSIAWVCTNFTNSTSAGEGGVPREGSRHEDRVLWYFTVCGLPLSIIALVFLLITYVMFKELHTLPGKNLMSLTVSLLLAQFVWLLASGDTEHRALCQGAAISLHFLFLVSFACMAVIAYDTRRAFPQHHAPITSTSFQSSSTKRVLSYLAFSWGLPLIFVITCVILDNQGVVAIGYGNAFACWLTQPLAQFVFFGVPIGVALLFNLIAFVRTVKAIRSTKKGSKQLNRQSGNQGDEVKIYFRLVTLMGFTWFFGFGANLLHHYLRYPFVVLTCLHGVYLALAFALKPHVFKLYKDKFDSLKFSRANTITSMEINSKSTPSNAAEPSCEKYTSQTRMAGETGFVE